MTTPIKLSEDQAMNDKVRELVERWRWEAANRPLKYASPQGAMDGCASDLERAMATPPSDEGRKNCPRHGTFGPHDGWAHMEIECTCPPAAGGEDEKHDHRDGWCHTQQNWSRLCPAPATPADEREEAARFYLEHATIHDRLTGRHVPADFPDEDPQRQLMNLLNELSASALRSIESNEGAVAIVLAEVNRATAKFPTWPTDPLHAVAVLGEEYGELTKAVLQLTYEPHKTSADEVRTEAIQTAAMALRFVASLDRYQFVRGEQHEQALQAALRRE